MFVIIGVAGELWADGGIFLFSSHLQTIADLEIAALTREAAEANDRASKNEREAAELRKEAGDARQKAGEATERAALLMNVQRGSAGQEQRCSCSCNQEISLRSRWMIS
ncbi:MAG: hypothetical protein DMG96_38425 [Acidobacteria bacterium]|nr:MAG: hypothetical protein DMG96_38425 [Acidobacteriota bacterium]